MREEERNRWNGRWWGAKTIPRQIRKATKRELETKP